MQKCRELRGKEENVKENERSSRKDLCKDISFVVNGLAQEIGKKFVKRAFFIDKCDYQCGQRKELKIVWK